MEKILATDQGRRHRLGVASRTASRISCRTSTSPDRTTPSASSGSSEGVQWVLEQGIETLAAHDLDLVRVFIDGVSGLDDLTYYGPQGVKNRLGVFSVRIDGLSPHDLAAILETTTASSPARGCIVRRGPTKPSAPPPYGGTTRFSFGPFLTKQDVKYATDALGGDCDEPIAISPPGDGKGGPPKHSTHGPESVGRSPTCNLSHPTTCRRLGLPATPQQYTSCEIGYRIRSGRTRCSLRRRTSGVAARRSSEDSRPSPGRRWPIITTWTPRKPRGGSWVQLSKRNVEGSPGRLAGRLLSVDTTLRMLGRQLKNPLQQDFLRRPEK